MLFPERGYVSTYWLLSFGTSSVRLINNYVQMRVDGRTIQMKIDWLFIYWCILQKIPSTKDELCRPNLCRYSISLSLKGYGRLLEINVKLFSIVSKAAGLLSWLEKVYNSSNILGLVIYYVFVSAKINLKTAGDISHDLRVLVDTMLR